MPLVRYYVVRVLRPEDVKLVAECESECCRGDECDDRCLEECLSEKGAYPDEDLGEVLGALDDVEESCDDIYRRIEDAWRCVDSVLRGYPPEIASLAYSFIRVEEY